MIYLKYMCMLSLWPVRQWPLFAAAATIPGLESRAVNPSATVLSQSVQAGISDTLAHNVATALESEKTTWTIGSVDDYDFCSVPINASLTPVGDLLQV